jgi:hypothetical protein
MDSDSCSEDGDIGDGSSFDECKKRKKTLAQHTNYHAVGNTGGGGIGTANASGYGNPWQWMQPP